MRWMKNSFRAIVGALALCASLPVTANQNDALTRMFSWWNGAITTPGAFTEEAFGQYFTEDTVLILNGKVSSQGIAELTRSFQNIQAEAEIVRIVLPFEESFAEGNRIFTHHFIFSIRNGVESCLRAMGYAELRDGKIARIHFVRVPYEPVESIDEGCAATSAAVAAEKSLGAP